MSRGDLPQAQVIWQSKGIIRIPGEVTTEANRAVQPLELLNAPLDLGSEMAHEALDRPGSGVTQSTDRASLDLFPER